MKKLLTIGGIAFVLAAIYVWFFVYNKPHKDIEASKADFKTTETKLVEAFDVNPQEANTKYNNKVLAFEGEISEIIKDDSLSSIVFHRSDSYSITCEVLPEYNNKALQLQAGSVLKVKGLYVGFMEVDPDFGLPGDIKLKKASF